MVTLAVTGGIACGKSLVLKYLGHLGAYCIDCDAIVEELYKKKSIQKKLAETFGTASKKELSAVAFNSEGLRKKLEAVMHPYVIEELKRELEEGKKQCRVVAAEVPLLFELSLEKLFDKTVVVKASREQQIKRLMARGLTEGEALKRIKSQIPVKEKVKKADFVIDNTSNCEELKKKVKWLFEEVTG